MSNVLLDQFPADVRAFIGPHLVRVDLVPGAALLSANDVARHAYFPTTAVLALRHEAEPGRAMVVALIGRDGMAGASVLLGADATETRVLVAGQALRLEAGHLVGEFERSAAMRQLLLGWLQVQMTQAVQAGACYRFHSPQQRLCMRLTELAQGQPSPSIALTQEQLGELAGVRRERANELLGDLLQEGLIGQQRGRIALLDAPGIARRACSCQTASQIAQSRTRRTLR